MNYFQSLQIRANLDSKLCIYTHQALQKRTRLLWKRLDYSYSGLNLNEITSFKNNDDDNDLIFLNN